MPGSRRLDGIHVFLALVILSGCSSQGGSGGTCVLAGEAKVKEVWCRQAHACRSAFSLSEMEFTERYGANYEACYGGADVPFVTTVIHSGEEGDAGTLPPERSDYWFLVSNCVNGLGRASCADVASDALLADGQYCGSDVLKGLVPPPMMLLSEECGGTTWQCSTCQY